jgi:uncharacterized protein with HEPN domain
MKDDMLYRYHIVESIDKIMRYIENANYQEFIETPLIQDAVLRNLQVMAESTQRLTDEFKNSHPEIEWYKISGLRNIVVYDYLGVDLDTVWNIIHSHLLELRKAVSPYLENP